MSWGAMAGNLSWGGVIEEGWRKGPWTAEEDRLLTEYVRLHGEGRWNSVARPAGLKRNGKSCRLRWVNYLRPDLKRGHITPHEESIILELHARWGNRWSTIARSLPGRTDNEIKNYWRTHFKKKSKISPGNSNKARNRLLKTQVLHHHHHHQQQQQQLQQLHELDMKRIMSLLEDDDGRSTTESYVPQMRQEVANIHPNTTEDHGMFYNMFNAINSSEAINEEVLWDGLWNLDDVLVNFGHVANGTCKPTVQNLVAPFC